MSENTAPEPELTEAEVSEQKAVRLAKRDRLNELGLEAYPVALPITDTIPAVRARFGDLEADATTGVTVGLAGRIVHLRNTGKLCFASLQSGDGSRIQAMVSLAEVGEENLELWKDLVDLGDAQFLQQLQYQLSLISLVAGSITQKAKWPMSLSTVLKVQQNRATIRQLLKQLRLVVRQISIWVLLLLNLLAQIKNLERRVTVFRLRTIRVRQLTINLTPQRCLPCLVRPQFAPTRLQLCV